MIMAAELVKDKFKRVQNDFDMVTGQVDNYEAQVASTKGMFQAAKLLYERQKQTMDCLYKVEIDKRTKLVAASKCLKLGLSKLKKRG